jgi:hypothetical protein
MAYVGSGFGSLAERQALGSAVQNQGGGQQGPSFADHGANTVNSVMGALSSGDPASVVSALGGISNFAQAAQQGQAQQSGPPTMPWNPASAPANSLPSFGSPQQLPNALAGSPFQTQFSMQPMAPTQGPAESEVANLYHNLLGRAPDQEGMEYWQNYEGPNRTQAFINAADPNNDLKYFNAVPGMNWLSRDFTLNTALPGQAQGGFGAGDPSRSREDYRQPFGDTIRAQQLQQQIDDLMAQIEALGNARGRQMPNQGGGPGGSLPDNFGYGMDSLGGGRPGYGGHGRDQSGDGLGGYGGPEGVGRDNDRGGGIGF